MKIKKSYLKRKYNIMSTDFTFNFSNNFCLKANKTREFQGLCLKNHIKFMFLPSSFGLSSYPYSQGPSRACVFAKNLGFTEIAFAEHIKEISVLEYKKRKLFYEIRQEKFEFANTKKYAQNFLLLLSPEMSQQNKTV